MASFSKKIDNIKLETYKDVIGFYHMLDNVSRNIKLEKPRLNFGVQFYIGDISCVCKNYEEFVEHAYGVEGFRLISADFHILDRDKSVIYIGYLGRGRVDATANSKLMLEQFLDQVQKEQKLMEQDDTIIMQSIIDSVVVTGNGNTIANKNSKIEIEQPQDEPISKTFWSGVLQNIASNLIWYLLTFGAGVLIAYLTTN